MKRIAALLLLIALALCGCNHAEEAYDMTVEGITYQVDPAAGTIYDGRWTYTFQCDGANVTIRYPNGIVYKETDGVGFATGSGGEALATGEYSSCMTLTHVLSRLTEDKSARTTYILYGIVLIALGASLLKWPAWVWYLRHALWVRDAEPSDFALTYSRISGGVAVIAGLLLMFTGV